MQSRDICDVSYRQAPEGDDSDDKFERITTVISSGEVDGHGTFMTQKTLENFAKSLGDDNIQFKDSHGRGQGFGVSEGGEFSDGVVTGTFKLRKDWPLSDASFPSSNQFIEGIRDGIITKTSVGFSGGDYNCTICDDDFFGRSCNHYPNFKYDIKDKDGNVTRETCTVAIDNAKLIEVSAVSSGSNPDAKIIEKAQRSYEEGTLPANVRFQLENNHGVRFADAPELKKDGGSQVEDKLQEQLDAVTTERDEAQAKVAELEALAECGREARKHMAKEALEAFKVSRGEALQDSDVERFEKRSEKMDFESLLIERDHLRTIAPTVPQVEPGSKTEQPDNSDNTDAKGGGEKEEKARGVNPPHWVV